MSAETIPPSSNNHEDREDLPRASLHLVGVVLESVTEYTPKPPRVFDPDAEQMQIEIDAEIMSSYPQTD